jgi:hypothetical protein
MHHKNWYHSYVTKAVNFQVKMALITHAYFEEGDFSKVSLLEETYRNLNSCLSDDLLDSVQAFEGNSSFDFSSWHEK